MREFKLKKEKEIMLNHATLTQNYIKVLSERHKKNVTWGLTTCFWKKSNKWGNFKWKHQKNKKKNAEIEIKNNRKRCLKKYRVMNFGFLFGIT